jgi:hypothetical protein
MPARRRRPTRAKVPRAAIRAQHLQLFELSAPRRCLAKAFLTRQKASPLPALQRASTSEICGFIFTKLLKRKPRRRHRVTHPTTHRWEPCEIGGVVEILSSENVLDDEVVGKAGDGLARDSIAARMRLRTHTSFHTESRVGRQSGGCRVRVVVSRGFFFQFQWKSEKANHCLSQSFAQHGASPHALRIEHRLLRQPALLALRRA